MAWQLLLKWRLNGLVLGPAGPSQQGLVGDQWHNATESQDGGLTAYVAAEGKIWRFGVGFAKRMPVLAVGCGVQWLDDGTPMLARK
mmetsp:Transcript_60110/g.107267  ORF Transcript_60110/g.107267 Transcript_60110/m.107267 type:complete len:86 (+) Transcript_60110:411-668(+)